MNRWLPRLYALKGNLTVAVMGCEVNGPGESKYADVGITGAGEKVLLFRHGKIMKTVSLDEADAAFGEILAEATNEKMGVCK
jgi:(E)-4-hydroxy-3-methylbut-2-enyl-diphosphate synthase